MRDTRTTVARFLGLSRDQRTNRWSITCPACAKQFEPQTTMRRYQIMQCPNSKCGVEMQVDYNAEPTVVEIVGGKNA